MRLSKCLPSVGEASRWSLGRQKFEPPRPGLAKLLPCEFTISTACDHVHSVPGEKTAFIMYHHRYYSCQGRHRQGDRSTCPEPRLVNPTGTKLQYSPKLTTRLGPAFRLPHSHHQNTESMGNMATKRPRETLDRAPAHWKRTAEHNHLEEKPNIRQINQINDKIKLVIHRNSQPSPYTPHHTIS